MQISQEKITLKMVIDLFANIDESVQSEVKLGDDKRVVVERKGSIKFETKQGEKKHIRNVYYVANLKHNLISIVQLLQKGYQVYFENDTCDFSDSHGTLIAKVQMIQNKMFPLSLQNDLYVPFKAVFPDKSWLWHLRFGHLSFNGLNLLHRKNMVNGLKVIEEPN